MASSSYIITLFINGNLLDKQEHIVQATSAQQAEAILTKNKPMLVINSILGLTLPVSN